MVKKSTEDGHSIPPFLLKCYELVDDPSSDSVISWGLYHDSFIVWNETEFTSELLPKYFKHSNFSSFQRQLNIYGFRKTDTDRWEFANEGFIKDRKDLLKHIVRKKPSQAPLQQKASEPTSSDTEAPEESLYIKLWKEVEHLKTDKNMLMQELVKLRQHQEKSESKLLLLSEQVKGMEKNQQQMLSFIIIAMQNPDVFVQFLHPKESNVHIAMEDSDIMPSDRMMVRYQPLAQDSPQFLEEPASTPEDALELDLNSDVVKDLFMNIDFMLGSHDDKLIFKNDPLILHDLPNGDGILEQLLSTSLSDEKQQNSGIQNEKCTDVGMFMGPTFESNYRNGNGSFKFLAEGFEKSLNGKTATSTIETQEDESEDTEVLTEQRHLFSRNGSSPTQL